MDDDDDDEDEDASQKQEAQRMVSKQYLSMLTDICKRMVREKIKYEADYYTRPLTTEDTTLMKLYMMRVSDGKRADSSKNITVYVSSTQQSVTHRIALHNNPDSNTRDNRTKCNATRWKFCLCVYIPENLRLYYKRDALSFTVLMRRYWGASHGVCGKLARGIAIANMFGLRYTFSADMEKKIEDIKKKKLGPDLQSPTDAFKQ